MLDFNSGDRCEVNLNFSSAGSGWYASGCVYAANSAESGTSGEWLALATDAVPLDLGSGPDDLALTLDEAMDPVTLPAATGGNAELTYSLSPDVPGLSFDSGMRRLTGTPTETGVWLMRYRVLDTSGDTDWRNFKITVRDVDSSTFGAGDTLPDVPTGNWFPDRASESSFDFSGNDMTIDLREGGYIEEGGYRYTCQGSAGCTVFNRSVVSGTLARTAIVEPPGQDDHGNDRSSATVVMIPSATQGVLSAGDTDYFRVNVTASGTLTVYTSGGIDTVGGLQDADGTSLDTNDDGGENENFEIVADVSPGEYYVHVRGSNAQRTAGNYTLHVRLDSPVVSGDYDANNNGLIEIRNLAQLNAIRWDPDGDGTASRGNEDAYSEAFPDAVAGMGCPNSDCTGYELVADLDFDTNGSGAADAGDDYFNNGDGWDPLALTTPAVFDGGGHSIAKLYINRPNEFRVGLFGRAVSARIRGVNLISASVTGNGSVGSLIGSGSSIEVANSSMSGVVAGDSGYVGGLIGFMEDGTITNSHSTGAVTSTASTVGGLIGGSDDGTVTESHATGDVTSTGGSDVGGLIGWGNDGTIAESHATGDVTSTGGSSTSVAWSA